VILNVLAVRQNNTSRDNEFKRLYQNEDRHLTDSEPVPILLGVLMNRHYPPTIGEFVVEHFRWLKEYLDLARRTFRPVRNRIGTFAVWWIGHYQRHDVCQHGDGEYNTRKNDNRKKGFSVCTSAAHAQIVPDHIEYSQSGEVAASTCTCIFRAARRSRSGTQQVARPETGSEKRHGRPSNEAFPNEFIRFKQLVHSSSDLWTDMKARR